MAGNIFPKIDVKISLFLFFYTNNNIFEFNKQQDTMDLVVNATRCASS